MVENYIVEEAIEFCSEFIAGVSSIGINSSVIKKNSNVDRGLSASSFIRPSKKQLDQAHLYVIQNVNDVLPYVEQHMESLRKLNSGKARSKKWIQEEHNRSFSRWLSTRMEDSSENEREMLLEVRKKSFVPREPTTMSELALVRNSGQKLPIQFNDHGQPVGATSKKMQSYIGVCVRQQIPITYNSWKEVQNELKDKIYDCISFPPKIYSHINQEDWESFVDARLSEEWENYSRIQRERRSKCVYNHHMSRKGYANLADKLKITHDVSSRSTLWKEARKGRNNDYFDDATRDCASRIDELVATNKNEDILTDALGSKERKKEKTLIGNPSRHSDQSEQPQAAATRRAFVEQPSATRTKCPSTRASPAATLHGPKTQSTSSTTPKRNADQNRVARARNETCAPPRESNSTGSPLLQTESRLHLRVDSSIFEPLACSGPLHLFWTPQLGRRVFLLLELVEQISRCMLAYPIRVVPAWVSFGITTYLGLCSPTGPPV
ncbi:uncharacterized protein E6C27_scaffold17G001540 [Cucumis melo var. makuwa]|uniref:CACTA en-spm transposon protein n=1 Tax=Cucumis melo var. makuwa TaxID=1194695 RepID=A0A5A7VDV7_CUCMM|nr:uncharacterized protein E6C27_scaffold17G001540 [Cucumis melo var. makuwa]